MRGENPSSVTEAVWPNPRKTEHTKAIYIVLTTLKMFCKKIDSTLYFFVNLLRL